MLESAQAVSDAVQGVPVEAIQEVGNYLIAQLGGLLGLSAGTIVALRKGWSLAFHIYMFTHDGSKRGVWEASLDALAAADGHLSSIPGVKKVQQAGLVLGTMLHASRDRKGKKHRVGGAAKLKATANKLGFATEIKGDFIKFEGGADYNIKTGRIIPKAEIGVNF